MKNGQKIKVSWGLRGMIWAGAALLALLLVWLLGFVLRDIGRFRTVDAQPVRERLVQQEWLTQRDDLKEQIKTLKGRVEAGEERRAFLADSVSGSRQTMQQMLDLQRAGLERDQTVTQQQQQAVEQAQALFLKNQQEYQTQLETLQGYKNEQRRLEGELEAVEKKIEKAEGEVWAEVRRLEERRDLQAAFLKLLVLLPFVALAGWLFWAKRGGPLLPVVVAVDAAVLWRLVMVIHEYFPTRYHKYIFLGLALAVILRALLYLIAQASRPGRYLLLKRYREAYRRGECPVCGYPIALGGEGSGQAAVRRGRRRLVLEIPQGEVDKPYTCPSCAQTLFEACGQCGGVRHSLLPACRHCGDERPLDLPGGEASAETVSLEAPKC